MTATKKLSRLIVTLYCVAWVLAICATTLGIVRGFQIDTNLKSLSPALSEDLNISEGLDKFSQLAESKFILVISSHDEYELEEAVYLAEEIAGKNLSSVQLVDQASEAESWIESLREHRYFLLPGQAQAHLQDQSDVFLLEHAQKNLHAMGAQFFSPREDPLGYLEEFALDSMSRIKSSGEIVELNDVYYSPLVFQSRAMALEMSAQSDILLDIETLIAELDRNFSGLSYLRSGVVFFSEEASRSAKRDISLISTGSLIGTIVLLLFIFRSLKPLLLPLGSIASGVAFAYLVSNWLFGSVHILTVVFGASLIGVVIDYALHYFYYRVDRPGESELRLVKALSLSLLTSIVGYAALSISGLAALQEIAFFSVSGLVVSWLTVLVVGNVLTRSMYRFNDQLLLSFVSLQLSLLKKIPVLFPKLLLLIVLTCFIFILQKGLNFNDSLRTFFSPSVELLEQERQVSDLFASYEPASFVLLQGETIDDVYSVLSQVRTLPQSSSLLGVDDFVPSPIEQVNNYKLSSRIYGQDGIAAKFLHELGVEDGELERDLHDFLKSHDQLLSPSTIFVSNSSLPPLWRETQSGIYSFMMIERGTSPTELTNALASIEGARYINSVDEATLAVKELRQRALLMLLFAVAAIAVLMVIRYRSIGRWALVAVPASSLMLCLLFINQAGLEITLFHTMALFLVLGLGMDYVIFVAEIRDHLERTLCAIVLSAMTSLLSFGLLSLSSLPVVSAFGTTVLVGNSINLLGCMLLAATKKNKQL
jgi:predicted exporter